MKNENEAVDNDKNLNPPDDIEIIKITWEDGGDTPRLPMDLISEAAQKAEADYLERRHRTKAYQALKRIEHELWGKLMDFENAYGFQVRGVYLTRGEANPFFEWRKERVQPLPQNEITNLDIMLELPKPETETKPPKSPF